MVEYGHFYSVYLTHTQFFTNHLLLSAQPKTVLLGREIDYKLIFTQPENKTVQVIYAKSPFRVLTTLVFQAVF